jgi:hypothetical protein
MADLSGASWRKSSFSGGNNDCVELAHRPNVAAVRDSKNVGGPVIRISGDSLACFLTAVREDGLAV